MNYLLAFKEYLLALKPQPSKITVKNYSIDVKHFIVWAEEKFNKLFDPKEITNEDIAAFRQDKINQLSARSLDRHISSLRKFFQALKLQGTIAQNPFDSVKKVQITADPFHLKEFKDFLYVYNASNLTIKNYIIDVKQFLQWAQETAASAGMETEDVLENLSDQDVSQYRDRLLAEHIFSPASINRKLSSLRKYLSWAASQNLIGNKEALQDNLNAVRNVISAKDQELPKPIETEAKMPIIEAVEEKPQTYSSFPPFRLAQKVGRLGLIIFDTVITVPLAHLTAATQKTLWTLQGKPLFKKQESASALRPIVRVKNISKATYAPSEVSTKNLPWLEKIIFHAKHTRPQWYKRYHSYAIAHYFNWAILMIFMTVIGFGFYNSFVTRPQNGQPLLAATAPPRILSFQGRLTDSANNAITTATNLRFGIYTDLTSTGSALLWQEVDNVQPDGNGVFSVILGKNSSIQQSLFANNQNLYLGITVGTTPELTPRQQLATVAYATNAETLQGLPPITQSGAGTNNVVLALDSSGNLTIGAASTFQTVGGTFTISGNSILLTSNAGTNGNVALKPDGTGFIDLQKPLVNTTLNNNISSAQGAVEVDDNFAVLATTSGIPAVTIDQNDTGAILSASSSGVSRFTIGNTGAITDSNYTTVGGVLFTDSTGTFQQTGTSTNAQCLIGGSSPSWVSCASIAGQSYWTLANGTLYPVNATLDLLIGGTSTAAAKFAVLNVDPGANLTTVASISAQNAAGQAIAIDSAGTIQTVNNAGLTLGGTTTGNITLSPLNGNGTVTVNGALAVTGQLTTSLIPSSTSINLGSPTNPFGNMYLSSVSGVGGYWQLGSGALSPTNITNDVLVGSTASGSARFHAYGFGGTVPAASASANTSYAALVINNDGVGDVLAASSSSIPVFSIRANGQLVANQYNTAGGVFYTNSSGVFAQASNASANTVLHGGTTPSFSAVSLTADVSGILPLANGGTNANLTADSGGIVYSGASSLAILAHSASVGQCLVSGGTGAPSWSSCASAASNWWNMNAGALYPINQTFDLTLGSSDGTGSSASAKFAVLNMSGSGTPTASVSSGLSGTGMYFTAAGDLQTANDMGLTVGGTTTGNITLSPQNGNGTVTVNGTGLQASGATFNLLTTTTTTVNFAQAANNLNVGNTGGTTTFASATINDNQSTVALLSSPTTVNFAAGATTALNIGGSTSPTNLNGNVVIGTSNTNTFTPNALMNADLIPTGNGVINLGSSGHYYNTVYANNFVAPVSGGTSGFWSLANDVIYPVNTYFDLAIGGTATASADWQVYSENVGSIIGGTATSSGMLSFRNTATKINLLNGATLDIQTSVGGDAGLASVLNIANNGDMTATGNLALNGGSLTTTAVTAGLFNTTATTVNIAGGASTATNIGHASGQIFLKGNVVLGTNNTNSITPNGEFVGSLIPQTTNSYDLGTSTLAWKNLYISGNYAGFWQRFNGTVSPYNITDDLAIGGTATSSAKFQIFGNTGNATTAGTLTFNSLANSIIQTTNMYPLVLGSATTGSVQLSPNSSTGLFVNNSGNVGIGNTSPSYLLDVKKAFNANDIGLNIQDSGSTNQLFVVSKLSTGGYSGLSQGSDVGAIIGTSNGFTLSKWDNRNSGFRLDFLSGSMSIGASPVAANAGLIINQNNYSGLGDIFTASAAGTTLFTIANDGTIKNSLIPNITDTYDLGSDPNAGGKEWNNLYVRQIITPATGGIAGFWQLNSGVLAPSNVNNDLTVGGNSTASARFQVYATGSGAGSISATLNNPKVNNDAGSLLASTSIINIGSANHTYMSLTNQDLTIGGHKNMLTTIKNVKKIIVYDTTKDSDGGAWTNDERAQASSWYSETRTAADACNIASNTRCGQAAFPRKAVIVITGNAGVTGPSIYIFDTKDNSLWMSFQKSSTTTQDMIGDFGGADADSAGGYTGAALNGRIYFGSNAIGTGTGALDVIDFKQDTAFRYTSAGFWNTPYNIKQRNTPASPFYTQVISSNAALPQNDVYDISVNVINGQTYVAAATRGSTNGSVALINESAQSLVATFGPNGMIANNVALTSTGDLYALVCTTTGNPCGNFLLKAKHNATSASGTTQLYSEVYGYTSSTNYGVATTDNNTLASLVLYPGPAATTAAQMSATALNVTQGTSTSDGISNTIYIGEGGSDGAVAALQENQASPAAGTIKYYKQNFITDDMVGDMRGYWPMSETSGNLADASIKGNTLVASTSGITYNVSGVRGTAVTLDGTSGYFYCPEGSCGGINNLDISGNAKQISAGAWVKTSTSASRQVILAKFNSGVGGSYLLTVEAGGKVMWALNGLSPNLYSVRTVADGNWHYVVGTYDGANMKIYIDGQLDGMVAKTGTFSTSSEDFTVGAYFVSNFAAGWFNGSIDQPFIATTPMEASEVAHNYQVGYRALQNHTANTIRGASFAADTHQKLINSNGNVSAVSVDEQNGKLYVGTQGGGVSVLGIGSDTITDAYSSSMTTTDDIGSSWTSTADFVQSVDVGQSYGNGSILAFTSGQSTSNTWMESQDTTLKDFFASNFNPFGATLNQNNLTVDNVLRVTNQLSTRLDNLAINATSSAALADVFRVDNNGMLLSRSLINSTTAMQFQDANANTIFNIDTTGLGHAAATINSMGTGDLFTASASGTTEFKVSNVGTITASSLLDLQNTSYFLDPAATGTSASVSGSLTFGGGNGSNPNLNILNGNDHFNIQTSAGGDTGLGANIQGYLSINARSMFGYDGTNTIVQSGSGHGIKLNVNGSFGSGTTAVTVLSGGNVGIGTTNPDHLLSIQTASGANDGINFYNSTGADATHTEWALEKRSDNDQFWLWGYNGTTFWNPIKADYANKQLELVPDSVGSVGIGTTAPSRTLDVTGNWGGNTVTDGMTGCVTQTNTESTAALYYDFNYEYGSGCGVVHTGTFNITGVPNTNGTFFFLKGRINNTGAATDTIDVKVNGTSIWTHSQGAGIGAFRTHGIVIYNSAWIVVANNPNNNDGFDLAEYMPHGQKNPPAGSIITNATTTKNFQIEESKTAYDQKAMGIVTTNPHLIFGNDDTGAAPAGQSGIAISGRVPTMVTSLDGPIDKGDGIATSPILGTGMRPNKPTQVVGKALEPFNPHDGSTVCTTVNNFSDIVWPGDDGSNAAHPCFGVPVSGFDSTTQQVLINKYGLNPTDVVYIGKILVLVGNNFVDPDVYLTTTGNLHIADASPSADFTVPHYYTLNDALGNPLDRMGAFLELAVANLRAGSIQAQQTLTGTLAVATDNVSIAGQSLRDYIIGVVRTSNLVSNGTLSPIAEIDQIHTNLISPLASNSAIAIDLSNSQFTIRNSSTGSAVASIDNTGNATFSGTLNSKNLAVNSDATVSGTLRAHRIVADEIDGLAAAVGTLSAQNITNVTNIYFATPSGTPTSGNIAMGQTTSSSSNSGLLTPYLGYTDVASYSSFLAYVPNLSASTAMFDNGLTSLGTTALSDTTITGQLSIGTNLILANNSINVLGSSFEIQPLRQGGVNFEGGLLAIDTDGNLTVNGNAVFAKTLAAHIISPLSNTDDLTLKLGQNPTATGAALATSNLSVQNASGSGIFTVDQLGNLVASGAANIAKLNFNLVAPAMAVSDTEVIATGSAGTAIVKAHQTEITIDNSLVTDKSLIYITPVGQSGVTPYLIRQANKTSFTVGISLPQYADTTFNWLIVN